MDCAPVRDAHLPSDARAALSFTTTEDHSPFFGIEEFNAIITYGGTGSTLRRRRPTS